MYAHIPINIREQILPKLNFQHSWRSKIESVTAGVINGVRRTA